MSQLCSNISYIICYREASNVRKEALLYVLQHIRQIFPDIEILLIEQDAAPKSSFDPDLNIRHLFISNPGPFNRSWAFNYATKNTSKSVFVFADADIFLNKEEYTQCFTAAAKFEAITPNKTEISNVAIAQDGTNEIQLLNTRQLYSFAGGMLIITRSAFEKIGGWDERFEGWGGEDNAMSHVIYNQLRSKTFHLANYHIDHPHEYASGNNHPQYYANRDLLAEILTRNGPALEKYTSQLKNSDLGNPEKYQSTSAEEDSKSLKFVLAITTYNRLEYLKICVESFLNTRDQSISWQLIIADDNSTDGTKEYLKQIEKEHGAIIIQNNRAKIHHQVNTIIKKLSEMTYDLCFRSDDDVIFLEKGWDKLYWDTIQRTGYQHLIFYDKNWQLYSNLARPIRAGKLVANCPAEKIQGAFYTLTKEVIEEVGYFDEQQFGDSGYGHIDYSFRCCRAGFNVLANPFDVEDSNDFIQLQTINTYSSTASLKTKNKSNSDSIIEAKKQLLKMDRIHIAYNENYKELTEGHQKSESKVLNRRKSKKYKKADATYYPERGLSGFLGFIFKRMYNLSIDLKLNFIPMGVRAIGNVLNKIGVHLINIDK